MARMIPAFVVAVSLSACALGGGRVETLSQAPSFRARTLAIAPVRGVGPMRLRLPKVLVARLEEIGLHGADMQESDSVLAGSALGLDVATNPRVLSEIRSATSADAIVFLSADPSWRAIDLAVLDATSGEPVLRSAIHPSGTAFESADEAAAAVAQALAVLAPERLRAKAKAAAADSADEIPVP